MNGHSGAIPGSLPAGARDLTFEEFHRTWLPPRTSSLAAAAAARHLPALTLGVTGGATFTYAVRGDSLMIEAGDTGATAIECDRPAFAEFADEHLSAAALLYSGRCRVRRGAPAVFLSWEPALRVLYHGRALLDLRHIDLRDRDGSRLDLSRAFPMTALDDAAAHFLATAGFLVVRAVFTADEVRALRGECERLRAAISDDDRRAWWGRHRDGRRICVRVNYAGDLSPAIQALFDDRRLRTVVAVSGQPVLAAADRLDGATVIFKTPGMVEGLSDLPWHRDCGMGGHPVMCPLINASVHLTDVTATSGDLRAIPGSFAGCSIGEPAGDDGISLAARAGDVTLHYGDLLHAAPPPTGHDPATARVTINLTHPHQRCFAHIGPRRGYNDVLFAPGDQG